MICPDCENGMVFHPMAHVRASKDFGKHTTCPQCNGSGLLEENSRDCHLLVGDQTSDMGDGKLVTN